LRAAFVAPKKMGKAVRRNAARRRLREAFRSRRAGLLQVLAEQEGLAGHGCDVIFLAAAGCELAPLAEMEAAIVALWRRALGDQVRCSRRATLTRHSPTGESEAGEAV
jgi:ribonuclease P protein component